MNKRLLENKIEFRNSIEVGSKEWGALIGKDIDNHSFCICGHPEVWHKHRQGICGGIRNVSDTDPNTDLCVCAKYRVRDNLRFLLEKYEKNKSKKAS